jgi:hypothetical protein
MLNQEEIKAVNSTLDAIIRSATNKELSDDIIAEALDELEGDYIAFMHENTLSWLSEIKVLTDHQVMLIKGLREKIDKIPPFLWNVESYRNSKEWSETRKIAENILSSLGIVKRQVDDELIDVERIQARNNPNRI